MTTAEDTPPAPGQATLRKSTSEQMEALRKRREQLDARLASLAARQKTEGRKRDARRKIIVGAAALTYAKADPHFRAALRAALRISVTRKIDKDVIPDLLE